jgi:large subunit ribosomal protein L10
LDETKEMQMPRPEKVQAVEEIKERFSDASASFITGYRGLTVPQQQTLRNALREAGASYKVYKMTLTKRAFNELGHDDLDEFLVGPTAIAFANEDPVPAAKALVDFGSENEALVVKAGWLNGEVLTPEIVAKLAAIESREVLLAKIAGAAKAPLTKMAGMLGSMTRDAASMFSQLLEKKEEDAPAEADEPAADAPAPTEEQTEEAPAADDAADAEPEAADDAVEAAPADDSAGEEAPAEDTAAEEAADEAVAEAEEEPAAQAEAEDEASDDDAEAEAEASDEAGDDASDDAATDDDEPSEEE